MKNDMNEAIKFANENPSSWLATSEDSIPHVRGMLMWFADESGFYYHTADTKRMCEQMAKNPNIEICFIHNCENFSTLTVAGKAERVTDNKLTQRLHADRPWLWTNMENSGVDTHIYIFRIPHGTAYFWDMSKNVREREIPIIEF